MSYSGTELWRPGSQLTKQQASRLVLCLFCPSAPCCQEFWARSQIVTSPFTLMDCTIVPKHGTGNLVAVF